MVEGSLRGDETKGGNVLARKRKVDITKARKRADTEKIFRDGRKRATGFVALFFLKNENGKSSYAIHARKKLGGAVERNRVKRIFREALRRRQDVLKGYDFIFIPRRESKNLKMCQLLEHLEKTFISIGLFKKQ